MFYLKQKLLLPSKMGTQDSLIRGECSHYLASKTGTHQDLIFMSCFQHSCLPSGPPSKGGKESAFIHPRKWKSWVKKKPCDVWSIAGQISLGAWANARINKPLGKKWMAESMLLFWIAYYQNLACSHLKNVNINVMDHKWMEMFVEFFEKCMNLNIPFCFPGPHWLHQHDYRLSMSSSGILVFVDKQTKNPQFLV